MVSIEDVRQKKRLRLAICAPFLTSISQSPEISASDITNTSEAAALKWEQLHTITSQLPFVEYNSKEGATQLAQVLQGLDKSDMARLLNSLIPWLADRGYIRKARQAGHN